MKAEPEYVFPFVNSLYRSAGWSPWNNLGPAMKRTYEGPVLGVGAVYAWSGNERRARAGYAGGVPPGRVRPHQARVHPPLPRQSTPPPDHQALRADGTSSVTCSWRATATSWARPSRSSSNMDSQGGQGLRGRAGPAARLWPRPSTPRKRKRTRGRGRTQGHGRGRAQCRLPPRETPRPLASSRPPHGPSPVAVHWATGTAAMTTG